MSTSYSLGSSDDEQSRLLLQRTLYGDTEHIKFGQSDLICEFGCGAGANLWIAQAIPHGRYLGIDLQQAQLDKAQALSTELELNNAEFFLKDCKSTGLADHSVDVLFCRCVLIHQPNPHLLLDEMCRITKPGGRLVLIEPHDVSYHVGPDMPHLMKAFQARNDYAYGHGRGSPAVAVELYPLLKLYPIGSVQIRPHVISAFGTENERFSKFMRNFVGLIVPVVDELIASAAITSSDWENAQEEAEQFSERSFLTQTLWIADARLAT